MGSNLTSIIAALAIGSLLFLTVGQAVWPSVKKFDPYADQFQLFLVCILLACLPATRWVVPVK